jgi:hypothetical protein
LFHDGERWAVLGTYMNVLVGGAGQPEVLHDAVGRRGAIPGAIPGARGPQQKNKHLFFLTRSSHKFRVLNKGRNGNKPKCSVMEHTEGLCVCTLYSSP